MIVLGIDPGTADTGYGVVHSAGARLRALEGGVIRTASRLAPELRLAQIHARVAELLDRHDAEAIAIEQLYFGANTRTAFAVGQARGVVLLAAGQRGVPARSYTPQQVKGAVCGSGSAGKDQVGRMVARLLGLAEPPASDHTADALAVAICDLNRAPLAAAVSRTTPPSISQARQPDDAAGARSGEPGRRAGGMAAGERSTTRGRAG
jgi:crossover junction endodeoxyribonuclease RuvC